MKVSPYSVNTSSPVNPCAFDADGRAVSFDGHAERAEGFERRGAVGARRVVCNLRAPTGQRGEQARAVRDGLVAGDAQAPAQTPCGSYLHAPILAERGRGR